MTDLAVTIGVETVAISIEGADLLRPLVERAEAAAESVEDTVSAVSANLDGLVVAPSTMTLGRYAQAYSNAKPTSPATQLLELAVAAGETIYVTSVQPAGDEFATVVFVRADGSYLSNVGQGAPGERRYEDAPVVVPANAAGARVTSRAGTIAAVRRAGIAAALATRYELAETSASTVDTSPPARLGSYVQAYTGAVIANGGSKYILTRVRPGQRIRVTATWPSSEYGVAYRRDGVFVTTGPQGGGAEQAVEVEVVVPAGVNEVGISGRIDRPLSLRVAGPASRMADRLRFAEAAASPWRGRTIAWFGTSIPATPNPGLGAAYPQLAADAIGATVINEAVGSSPVRFGHAANRTGGDPNGIAGQNWMNVLYALASTLAEKNDLIANWATYRGQLSGNPPATLDDNPATRAAGPTGTDFIRSCSYEVRLARNLPPTRTVDLIVIDHGYNDLHGANADSDIATAGIGSRDRGTFIGGVNFLVDAILAANPRQRIAFAEHYEAQLNPKVAQAQALLAAYWSFPLLPLAGKLGWSQRQVTIGGVQRTLLQQACPDGVHPHADETGVASAQIARQHATNLAAIAG